MAFITTASFDLDLLRCLDGEGHEVVVDDQRLQLPHPLMEQRDFVMNPLRELMKQTD